MNPLMLYASSGDKSTPTETYDNFSVEFPQSIVGCTRIEVLNVTVPMTCYNIPEYERYLYMQVSGITNADMSPNDIIRLTFNYKRVYNNVQDFVGYINNATVTAYNMTQNKTINFSVGFAYDANIKRITFFTNLVGLKIRFLGYLETDPAILALVPSDLLYYNLSYRMGFVNRYATPFYASSTELEADNPDTWTIPSILRTSMIYITSNVSQGGGMTSNVKSNGHYDILAKVPVNYGGSPGSVVYYEKNLLDKPIIGIPSAFKKIFFKLLDDEGKPLGLASDGPATVHITLRLWYDKNL